MRRFFAERIGSGAVEITGQEAKHISRVLRMQPGDMLVLFDGSGVEYTARITGISKEAVAAQVVDQKPSDSEPRVNITICQALIKSDHLDYVTQKCTELGASRIIPFLSARCVKRPDAAAAQKLVEKQRRVALEAAKQCGRSRIPAVLSLVDIGELPAQFKDTAALLAYEDEKNTTIRQALKANPCNDVTVIIGPEGGFEPAEAALLTQAGARACSLGRLILRAETAGPAALAMILYEHMERDV